MKGIPQNAHVSRLVASKYDAATVYLTLSNRREDDNKPYIFRSTDYGENWQSYCRQPARGTCKRCKRGSKK